MVLARSQKPGTVPNANVHFPGAEFTSEFRVLITSVSVQFIFLRTTPKVSVFMSLLSSETSKGSHWIKSNLWTEFWEGWGNASGKGSNILCATLCEERSHPVMPALDPPGARPLSSWPAKNATAASFGSCLTGLDGWGRLVRAYPFFFSGLHVIIPPPILQSSRKEAVWAKCNSENFTDISLIVTPTVRRWNYSAQSIDKDRALTMAVIWQRAHNQWAVEMEFEQSFDSKASVLFLNLLKWS